MKSTEKIYKAIEMANDDAVKKILREFIMDNMPAPPKSKLQMKEFLSEDKVLRPQLCCICMDNEEKTAVATNAHILFASKEYYVDKGREGESKTLVDEYGDVVKEELRYPNWKAVVPREDQTEPIVLRSDLEELIKLAQVEAKELGLKKIDYKTNIRVADNICIRLDFLKLMLKAGLDGWRKPKNERVGGIVKQWEGNTMVVMPVCPPEVGDEDYDNLINKGYWFNR